MDGREFIKEYQGVIPDEVLEQVINAQEEGHADLTKLPDLDHKVFLGVGSLIGAYASEFQYFGMYCGQIYDDGYSLAKPSGKLECASDRAELANMAMSILLFCDDESSIEFPLHGVKIEGETGKAVLFPSQWTHPFKVTGSGAIIRTNIRFGG